jgi:hypothetical protein
MKRHFQITATLAVLLGPGLCQGADSAASEWSYEGTATLSGAVAIAKDMFIACSSDDNVLRVYRTEGPGAPVAQFDASDFLGLQGEPADLRGAARSADRVYWIASHSRDQKGQVQPARHRFFATAIKRQDDTILIEPVGKPCTALLNKLPGESTVSTLRLDKALGLGAKLSEKQQQRLAPDREGLSIDAFWADPHIDVLLIGCRNPRPVRVLTGRPHALMIPLNNAPDVIEKRAVPIFGEATLWDFDGLGITCLVYSPAHGTYFILAQPHDGDDPCMLYRWSGMKAHPPEFIRPLRLPGRETTTVKLVPFENTSRLLLLTGVRKADATLREKRFRGLWIQP